MDMIVECEKFKDVWVGCGRK